MTPPVWHPVARAFYSAVWQNVEMQHSSRRECICGFEPRGGHHINPIKKGTMKDLFDIIVAREEGFTSREWIMGGAFCIAIVAICLVAEIINAL